MSSADQRFPFIAHDGFPTDVFPLDSHSDLSRVYLIPGAAVTNNRTVIGAEQRSDQFSGLRIRSPVVFMLQISPG